MDVLLSMKRSLLRNTTAAQHLVNLQNWTLSTI